MESRDSHDLPVEVPPSPAPGSPVRDGAPVRAPLGDLWRDWQALRLDSDPGVPLTARLEIEEYAEPGKRILISRTMAEMPDGLIQRSRSRSVLDSQSGRVVEQFRQFRDQDRRYRFRADGYTVETLQAGMNVDEQSTGWQVLTRREFRAPLQGAERTPIPVFDFHGLLAHLRGCTLYDVGDMVDPWIATTSGPRPCRFVVRGCGRSVRTLQDRDRGVSRDLDIHELRLEIPHLDSDCDDEMFLGMEGDAELVVEASSRTILELHGSIPGIPGITSLQLTSMS